VVHEDGIATAPRPRLELNLVQRRHIVAVYQVQPFGCDEARVGGFLFRLEFGGEVFGNDCVGFHGVSPVRSLFGGRGFLHCINDTSGDRLASMDRRSA
jgi:hypothetical protein